jgi:hypothetical protein
MIGCVGGECGARSQGWAAAQSRGAGEDGVE